MNPIWKKMKVKEGQSVVIHNAPPDLDLQPWPGKISKDNKSADVGLLFAENKRELDLRIRGLQKRVGEGLLWIAYPKKSSGRQTDLTMYNGWDILDELSLEVIALVSLNSTWSAVRVRSKSKVAEGRAKRDAERRVVQQYVDRKKKTVRLPVELKEVLSKNKKVLENFEKLSFTHKREYVEWIVTAKQDKTKIARLQKLVSMLS